MSKTAQELNLSESTVSRAIQKLEEQLDIRLIQRDVSPFTLTPAGRKIAVCSQKVLDSLQSLYDLSVDLKKSSTLALNIASATSFTRIFSPYIVTELMTELKSVNAYTGSSKEVCNMLLRNDVDIAIANEPMSAHPSITSIPVYQEDFLLVLSKRRKNSIKTLEDLSNLAKEIPFAQYSPWSTDYIYTSRIIRQWWLEASTVSLDAIETMMKLISEDRVWALLPTANILAAEGQLSEVRFEKVPAYQNVRNVFVLYKNNSYSHIAEKLRRYIHQTLQDVHLPKLKSRSSLLANSIRIL